MTAAAGNTASPAPAHGTVICVALNHREQLAEMDSAFRSPPHNEPPRSPILFIKPENTITGHGAPVQHPAGVPHLECGAALALVMSTKATRVAAQDAYRYIRGYTLFIDVSLPGQNFFRPPVRSRCFDSFGPLGPRVTGLEALPDPRAVILRTSVNGVLKQEFRVRDLFRSIPELVASITEFMTLEADDVIATGFAPGPITAGAGDVVSVDGGTLGVLEVAIVSEPEYYARAGGAA